LLPLLANMVGVPLLVTYVPESFMWLPRTLGRCEPVERDRHGRLVAKVFSPNGIDIGRRLVAAPDGAARDPSPWPSRSPKVRRPLGPGAG
jgi:hypothetical protein